MMDRRNSYSRYDTHITFFMAGVCCMIINSVVDLESLVLLRFLGNSSYDAQTITFFLRRFNLIIGILISCLAIFFDVNIRCSVWHWALFMLYFLVTFYIYLLSNNVLTISKYGLAPVFTISMVSHGLLVSTVVYIFEGVHVKYDKNVALCLIIFLCGCFSSGLLVKMLLRFSGDIKDDEHLGLRFYNRLFVLFTVINLLSCFLLSRLTSMDPHYDGSGSSTNKSLHAVLFSRSRWVFFMGCVSWSFSPMFNNFTASVINSLSSMEAFNLEYMQFIICLAFSFSLYLVVITDIVVLSVGSSGTRSSETLTDVICSIMNITNETNPHIAVEDGIVEDLVTNDSINVRLFRAIQPWCYLQWGFWTSWENYDAVDNLRIITVMNINMMISRMRDGFAPVDDVGSTGVGGTTVATDNPFPKKPATENDPKGGSKDLQSEYLCVIDAKYSLTWEITCFIKQCNETLSELPNIFHVCYTKGGSCDDKCAQGDCSNSSCKSHTKISGKDSGCVLMCLKNCCTSKVKCLGGCLANAFREKFVDTTAPFYPGSTVDITPFPPDPSVVPSANAQGSDGGAAKPAAGADGTNSSSETSDPKSDTTAENPTYCSVIKHKCVACDPRFFGNYRTFVYGILTACITEAQKLLDEIGEDPDLVDTFKVSKTNELTLMAMEQYVLKFLGILVYARVADEFLLLFQQMRHIAVNTTKWVIQYLCQHKCSADCLFVESKPDVKASESQGTKDSKNGATPAASSKNTDSSSRTGTTGDSDSAGSNSAGSASGSNSPNAAPSTTLTPGASSSGEATEVDPSSQKDQDEASKHKCLCLLYCKFVQCVVRLHNKQIQTCQVVLGMSRLSIASVLPTLSMTRSVALFSHFFGEFMRSPSIVEHSNCKCGSRSQNCKGHKVDDLEKCILEFNENGTGLAGDKQFENNKRCGCGSYSARVDDLLDLMIAGLGYLSEYDGILSIIIFFYSYLTDFHLEPICEISTSPKDAHRSVESGTQCTCCAEKGLQCDCEKEGSCKLCISCLCCPKEGKCADTDKKEPCADCKCSNTLTKPQGCKKCCLCSIFCPKCHKECCVPKDPPTKPDKTCPSQQNDNCCQSCTKDCLCCSDSSCSPTCCTCCYIRSHNPHTSGSGPCEISQTHTHKPSASCAHGGAPKLLRLSENSKRNLELITATRRTMVLQSMSDYILRSNFFKDLYKNLNNRLVHDKMFLLYLALCFGLYVLSVVGNVVPYVRNVSHVPKLTLLFSVSSVLTVVSILYSFLCMSDFGPDSSLIINLMILISMILCIVWSWTTQWLSYRILLYQQFETFYNKFRLIYTGSVNIYEPKLTWWFEGFVSFIKTDFHTMYLILLLKDFKDNYDPYSFGFTSRLKLNYSLLRSYNTDYVNTSLKENLNDHMFQYEDFVHNMERHLLDPHNFGKDVDLYDILDYRAFQLIPKDSYHFLTDLNSFERMSYSLDMVFAAWNRNVKMTRLADRLQFLREGALKTVEELVQNEAKRNNYDRNSIRKLKHYFDFRSGVLVDLAKNCLHDLINHGSKLASIQLSTLISIYELEYSKRWATYFAKAEARSSKPSQGDAPGPAAKTVLEEVEYVSMNSETLLKKFKKWKRRKLRLCDEVYDGSLICKLAVNKAADEFEFLVFDRDAVDPLHGFVRLISSFHSNDKLADDIEVTKYLSHVSKTRDVLELDKVKSEITNLILKDTSNYVGSLIKGYVSVCKSMVQESNMQDFILRNNEIVIGEWIRWQGQHVSSDVIELFSKFTTIDAS